MIIIYVNYLAMTARVAEYGTWREALGFLRNLQYIPRNIHIGRGRFDGESVRIEVRA